MTTVSSTPPASREGSPPSDRLQLHGRAPENLRRHLLRSARRFLVLVAADLLSFLIMRTAVQAIRDQAMLGPWIAERAHTIMARGSLNASGFLNGWQFAFALVTGLLVTGSYGVGDRRRDSRRLFVAAALATALPLWATIWTRGLGVVLVQFVVTTTAVWALLVVERRTVDRVVQRLPRHRGPRAIFVGAAADCRTAAAGPAFAPGGDYRSLGFVDLSTPAATDAMGDHNDLARLVHQSGADTIVICGQPDAGRLDEIMGVASSAGCHLLAQSPLLDVAGAQPALVWRHDQPFIDLTVPSLQGWQRLVKRAVDLIGSIVGLVVLSPLFLVIAAFIKRDSQGPVFFRQERIGAGGSRFRVWKFRTMRHGASDAAHRELVGQLISGDEAGAARQTDKGERVYKLTQDERVTRTGGWLRRTSLDELPQLLNVLVGEMSLVGPRPPVGYEVEAYDHWQFDRLQVQPGITGLWQVSGRSRLTYREMCELDLHYVRHWSLWLDLKILIRTIPAVMFNSGRAA